MHEATSTHRRHDPYASRVRWADLAGREHGCRRDSEPTLVLLHGLTFDHRMWDPVLEALPGDHRAIALSLPGHGGSPALEVKGLEPVVAAIHEAVLDDGAEAPILVGHSIGGPLASMYAATFPSRGVISIEAPIRLEPLAAQLQSLRTQLTGEEFAGTWARFRDSWRMDLVPDDFRALLRAGEGAPQELVLAYQSDLLDRPLEDVVRLRDESLERLRESGTPYLALHANPVDPAERAWLAERLPQARSLVWPVHHHFPQLADPGRFAALLTGFAAGCAR